MDGDNGKSFFYSNDDIRDYQKNHDMMKPKVIAFRADNINTIDNEGDAE